MDNLTKSIMDDRESLAQKAVDEDGEIVRACVLKNPFTKEHWNLTMQCKITNVMPDFAKALEKYANLGKELDESERNAWIEASHNMKAKRASNNGEGETLYMSYSSANGGSLTSRVG